MKEKWKEIRGYEGYYAASTQGDVKRLKSVTSGKAGKILKLQPTPNGYLLIQLSRNGEKARFLVHRLVWETFNGKIPTGYHVNHLNGEKIDNRLINLECVTPGENQKHAYRVLKSRNNRGVNNSQSKLTPDKVRKIRQLISEGIPHRKIGEIFNVHGGTISAIATRKNWSHVE